MRTLGIDLETYSELDIKKAGLYRYAENSEILLFAYAFDDEPVQVVDFATGEELPEEVLKALWDPDIRKTAYNASFEIHVINHWLETEGYIDMGESYMDPAQWYCTMVQGWTLGLPGGLEKVGKALNLAEDKQKLATGKRLIQFFSKPCKPTNANGLRTRNLPQHDMEKWNLFKEYCGQDVEAERAIRKRLEAFMPNETERRLWCLDQEINDRGVLVDWKLVNSAVCIDEKFKAEILDKARALTGLDNPNSNAQVLKWIEQEEGWKPKSLDKEARAEMMEQVKSDKTRKLLQYKDLLGKTSVKKYIAMQEARCRDNRVHGMLQFYGASRTGRWAGRLIQLHNLPRNSMEDLDEARELAKAGDYEGLSMMYDKPSDVLSQLIRTAFIAPKGKRFIVADFSAIEARVIAWLADEKWRMDAFAAGKDIYCASASQMFGVPVEKHGVNGELRAKGKVAELACIAEGELVLTDKGLKPIETVSLDDRVWDGEKFVHHEGVIYKGVRDVFLYDGLKATADHLVYIEGQSEPVRFDYAASCGSYLVQTGYGGHAIRVRPQILAICSVGSYSETVGGGDPGTDYRGCTSGCLRKTEKLAKYCGKAHVYDIRNAGLHHRYTVSGKLVHNCGYGGGAGALMAFGADKMGLSEADMDSIIKKWRKASPHIVRMWSDLENAVRQAIRTREVIRYKHGVELSVEKGILFMRLPSGRRISYLKPRVEREERFNRDTITYEGVTTNGSWGRNYTWGGKLVENLVQATARDCLGVAMLRLTAAGYKIVMHVHDEVILEMPIGDRSLEEACGIMGEPIPWAPGLLLTADGYETDEKANYYKKD